MTALSLGDWLAVAVADLAEAGEYDRVLGLYAVAHEVAGRVSEPGQRLLRAFYGLPNPVEEVLYGEGESDTYGTMPSARLSQLGAATRLLAAMELDQPEAVRPAWSGVVRAAHGVGSVLGELVEHGFGDDQCAGGDPELGLAVGWLAVGAALLRSAATAAALESTGTGAEAIDQSLQAIQDALVIPPDLDPGILVRDCEAELLTQSAEWSGSGSRPGNRSAGGGASWAELLYTAATLQVATSPPFSVEGAASAVKLGSQLGASNDNTDSSGAADRRAVLGRLAPLAGPGWPLRLQRIVWAIASKRFGPAVPLLLARSVAGSPKTGSLGRSYPAFAASLGQPCPSYRRIPAPKLLRPCGLDPNPAVGGWEGRR